MIEVAVWLTMIKSGEISFHVQIQYIIYPMIEVAVWLNMDTRWLNLEK